MCYFLFFHRKDKNKKLKKYPTLGNKITFHKRVIQCDEINFNFLQDKWNFLICFAKIYFRKTSRFSKYIRRKSFFWCFCRHLGIFFVKNASLVQKNRFQFDWIVELCGISTFHVTTFHCRSKNVSFNVIIGIRLKAGPLSKWKKKNISSFSLEMCYK